MKYEVWVKYRLCDPQVDAHCSSREEAEEEADKIRSEDNVVEAWVTTEKARYNFSNNFEDECSGNGYFD
jgi:hypothetical protein